MLGADGKGVSQEQKVAFKRIVMTVCMTLWGFVSVAQQMEVRAQLAGFLPDIDSIDSSEGVEVAAARFLGMAHGMVDDTEVKMLEALQAHYSHHQERKRATKERTNHLKGGRHRRDEK